MEVRLGEQGDSFAFFETAKEALPHTGHEFCIAEFPSGTYFEREGRIYLFIRFINFVDRVECLDLETSVVTRMDPSENAVYLGVITKAPEP